MKPSASAPPSRGRVARVRDRVQNWFAEAHRDLPWRRTRDPYAIWVSETMLQQTRVDTVIPYYERFLERFPVVRDLAEASQDEVFAHWAGLGYYRRAANLHRAAQTVRSEHAGHLPEDEAALLALPGVGRYTAGALRSIAFGLEAPVLDGNVARVLSRVFLLEGEPRENEKQLWQLAARVVVGSRPSDLNQGLMELGATVCTPRAPRCESCPLRRVCEARRQGLVEAIPAPATRKPVPVVRRDAVVLARGDGRVLLMRRAVGGLWSGLWDLPAWDDGEQRTASRIASRLAELLDLSGVRVEASPGRRKHVLTHRRYDVRVWSGVCESAPVRKPSGYTGVTWIDPARPLRHGTSKLVRCILEDLR